MYFSAARWRIGIFVSGPITKAYLLAVLALEAQVADALVLVDKVEAGAAVLARVGRAVVQVDLAVLAAKAGGAAALVVVVGGQRAGAAILAGRGVTSVDLQRANNNIKVKLQVM